MGNPPHYSKSEKPQAWPRAEPQRRRPAPRSNAGSIVASVLMVLQLILLGACVVIIFITPEVNPEWIKVFVDETEAELGADVGPIYEVAFVRDCIPWLYARVKKDNPFPVQATPALLPFNTSDPSVTVAPTNAPITASKSMSWVPALDHHQPTTFQAKWCSVKIIGEKQDFIPKDRQRLEDEFVKKSLLILGMVAVGTIFMCLVALSSCLCIPTNCCRISKTLFVSLGNAAMGYAMHQAWPYCDTVHIIVFAAGNVLQFFSAILISQCANK